MAAIFKIFFYLSAIVIWAYGMYLLACQTMILFVLAFFFPPLGTAVGLIQILFEVNLAEKLARVLGL